MTERLQLTRRKALAGLGAIGAASAGAGLGTSAYFSDEERYPGNELVAGQLDLKVAWIEHYSNWSDDEAQFLSMADSADDADLVLPAPDSMPDGQDILLEFVNDSRRDWLGFLNTTTQEAGGNLTGDPCENFLDVPDDLDLVGNERPVIQLSDVKPGDFGMVCSDLVLCDNPGFLWMNGRVQENAENGTTEPESEDPDEGGTDEGELPDVLQVIIWYEIDALECWPNENVSDEIIFQGSLREAMNHLTSGLGIPLDSDLSTQYDELAEPGDDADREPFLDVREGAGERAKANIGFLWYLPVDHANEIQTDSVTFDLGFYTEQARHNDGSGMAPEELITLTGDSPQGQGTGFANPWDTSDTLAHRGGGSWGTVDHGPNGTDSATDEDNDGRLEYKQGFYFGAEFSDFDVLPEFTVGDIDEVSYWLYEPSPLGGVDIYLSIYTRPEGDGDDAASWYDSRLQALPSAANGGSPNFTPGEWNEFSTAGDATNTLTWSDTGRGGNFVQPLPTLADVQSDPVDWSQYGANLSMTHDYRDESVLALSLQTGSESGVTLEAYIDDVTVRLADGSELVLDLEP